MADEIINEKYFLGFYGWHKNTRKYISNEEANKILEMYGFLSMINSIEENYDIVVNNFFDLYNSLAEISVKNNISFSFKPIDMFCDERLVIRKINNLLSSCRLFLDQNLALLSNYNSELENDYKKETNKLYDEFFSYRLCEQLRNSMQHRCLPVELRYSKHFSENKSEKAVEYLFVDLNIHNLLAFDAKKLKASIREELKNKNTDKLDLWFCIEEYITNFGKLILFIRKCTNETFHKYRYSYLNLIVENQQIKVDEKYEIQKMIHFNKEYQDGTLGSLILSDSLIKNIELLQEKNHAMKDFSKHEIKI